MGHTLVSSGLTNVSASGSSLLGGSVLIPSQKWQHYSHSAGKVGLVMVLFF